MSLMPKINWLFPMPEKPISLPKAFKEMDNLFIKHQPPVDICSQCFDPDWALEVIKAAHQIQNRQKPNPKDFSGIYFEHPNCVGGEETIKLFFSHGLREILARPNQQSTLFHADVLETALKAGFWFWPEPLKSSFRVFTASLFYEWFENGCFDLDNMHITTHNSNKTEKIKTPQTIQIDPHDVAGFNDDIMMMCVQSLLDPADLIYTLSKMHTPWADEILSFPCHSTPSAPFYCSPDTSRKEKRYKIACEKIAKTLEARTAKAIIKWITPDWLGNAFFRNVEIYPKLAANFSEYENNFEIYSITLKQRAKQDIILNWPNLPSV